MTEVSRIWDEKKVKGMAKVWRDPNELDDSALENDRHWRLINSVFKFVEGDSILDVGCGLGHLYVLAKNKYNYSGIDGSREMIKTAQSFYPDDAEKFRAGDAYDLSEYGMYDTVVASGLLLHLYHPLLACNQMWGKANRCIVFSVWVGDSPVKWEERQPIYKRVFGIKDKNGVLQRRDTLSSVASMLKTLNGITKVSSEPFPNPYDGESNYIFKVSKNR